jgi:hypothetical protein
VRLYDEQTKSLVLKMKERKELCGHSNRIFCVKFDPNDSNKVVSGGWDNTVQFYDIRSKGPVASIYGPHVCGKAIDFHNDGHTLLTGSYRQEDVLELWDMRVNKKFRDIRWDGPKASEVSNENMEEEKSEAPGDEENQDPSSKDTEGFDRKSPAPFLYSTQFNHK